MTVNVSSILEQSEHPMMMYFCVEDVILTLHKNQKEKEKKRKP